MRVPRLRLPWRPRWFFDETALTREGSRSQGRKLTYQALELGSNNFSVTLVAALGFYTSSYILFASNKMLPMLAFVYWHDATDSSHETAFNNATIAGCIVGMVLFGLLADMFGRRKMYGFEIVLLMLGTMGVVLSSTGYMPLDQAKSQNPTSFDYRSFGSMNIQSWLLFWRFVSGVGVGGDTLSVVIVSEFAPTSTRPRMLATVIALQSFGIATGSIVSLVATKVVQKRHPYDPVHPEASARALDQLWRWVIGLGLIPALFTAIMRFTIPESPRYTLDVLKNPYKAFTETERLKGFSIGQDMLNGSNTARSSAPNDEERDSTFPTITGQDVDEDPQTPSIRQYFITEGNWRYLLATSLSWFLFDFGVFSLALNSAQTLSKFWNGPNVIVKDPKVWDSNTTDPNASIFSILIANNVQSLVIISIPAITGSVLLVLFITRINRRLLLWVMLLVSGVLLAINGATLLKTQGGQTWGINIALYAFSNFADNFGATPLTFLIPAELFPTAYRARCHGIAAAFGKLGAVLAEILIHYVEFAGITESGSPTTWLGYVLITFSGSLFLGAFVCWLWIPELQDQFGRSKTLEELAKGRRTVTSDTVST